MKERLTLVVQMRLFLVCVLVFTLLVYAPHEIGTYKSEDAQVWKQFRLACFAAVTLVLLFPLFKRRIAWLQVIAICLAVLPLLVLCWAIIAHFR